MTLDGSVVCIAKVCCVECCFDANNILMYRVFCPVTLYLCSCVEERNGEGSMCITSAPY